MDFFEPPKPGCMCETCKTRQATKWLTEGAIAMVHGCATPICEICILTDWIAHAKERAAMIPEMEAKLKSLLLEESMEGHE